MTESATGSPPYCTMPGYSVVITLDGDMWPCCYLIGELPPCASLAERDAVDAWRAGFAEIRQAMASGNPPSPCAGCFFPAAGYDDLERAP